MRPGDKVIWRDLRATIASEGNSTFLLAFKDKIHGWVMHRGDDRYPEVSKYVNTESYSFYWVDKKGVKRAQNKNWNGAE